MKKYLRRISLLLAIVMLFSTVLIACKKDDDDDNVSDGSWSLGDSGKAATPDNIPEDTDFNGYEFKILYRPLDWLKYYECEGAIEGADITPVHRSVYERNMRVQNRLNCKLKYIGLSTGAADKGAQEVMNHLDAEDYYDFFMLTNNLIVQKQRNYQLVDFNDAEYIEYHQPWWWDEVMTEMAFDARTINYLVGDITNLNIGKMSAIYFNFDLIEQYLQKTPQYFYDLVNEKKWTYEVLNQIASNCYRDLNGNGDEDDGDMFAFPWTGVEVNTQLLFSNKVVKTFYTRDNAGLITINMEGNNDIYRMVTAIRSILRDNEGVRDYSHQPSGTYDHLIVQEFANNKYVFLVQRLSAAFDINMRNMQSLYGIIPYPTLDEGDDYFSDIHSSSSTICAPKIAEKNLEMIGICIEALCSETYRYTIDEFFNMALKSRYTNDVESAKMIDTIYESASKCFLIEYGGAALSITGCLSNAINGNTNVMTLIAGKSGAQQAINNYITDTKALMLGYSR